MDNAILAYWQQIEDGTVTVGKWIRALYGMMVDRIESGRYIYSQKKADRAIRFIESFAHHNKGSLAPGNLQLQLWQRAAVSLMFGIVDEHGLRQFREVFLVVGRKCGKSLLASGIMEYMVYGDGEFGPEVYCVAPKLDQADLVYSAFRFSVEHEPSLEKITRSRKMDLYVQANNATIKKIAFSEKKADGYNPHLVVCDEGSSWPGQKGLLMYEVMNSGQGARSQPMTLMTTSGGYEDDGIYDELMKRATAFFGGDSREERLLPILYMIDDPEKWDDITEVQKSLPGLGVSVSARYMLDQIAIARSSLSKRTEYLAKYCNLKQNTTAAWFTAEDVARCTGEPLRLEDFHRCYAVAGVDLSRTTDLTCAGVLIERDGVLHWLPHFWLPSERITEATAEDNIPYRAYEQRGLLSLCDGHEIDYRDVEAWLLSVLKQYRIYILRVGYDRYSATYLVQDLDAAGLKCDSVYQGENLTGIINQTEALVRDGKLRIGDNDLMKMHLLDSALKINNDTDRKKLVKLRKRGHIDGTAALLDAMCMRSVYHSELGRRLENRPREG